MSLGDPLGVCVCAVEASQESQKEGEVSITLHMGEKMGTFVSLGDPLGVCVCGRSFSGESKGRGGGAWCNRKPGVAGVEGLSDTEVEQLRALLYNFSSVISMSDSDIGRTHVAQHHNTGCQSCQAATM